MKRALAWLAGLAGIAALGRLLARPKHRSARWPEPPPPAAAGPAEALKLKLAEQRGAEKAVELSQVDETLEERRARVHAKAREAIEEMHDDGPAA